MKLTELYLNRFLYRDTSQNLETKDSAFVSADSTPADPSPIYSGGAAQDINTGNVQINGAQLEPGTFPQTVLDVSNWGWGQTCAFSSTDLNTVSWGAGTFKSADGTSYSISAGNTGNMAAKTYIYLDLLTSTTVYQITTTPGNAVGVGKVLVAVANPDTTTATYNLSEATQIVGDNILANSINASKIVTGQLIVGTNVGLGTAQDSAGVTTIIGNTVTTGYVNALSITAGSVAAENITGTNISGKTITGSTLQTGTSGQNINISTTAIQLRSGTSVMAYWDQSGQGGTGYLYTNAIGTNVITVGQYILGNGSNLYISAHVLSYSARNFDLGSSSAMWRNVYTDSVQITKSGYTTKYITMNTSNNLEMNTGLYVGGTLSKAAGSFRIDHPLKPATHYLQHSFVESPDMLNLYAGNGVLKNGLCEIQMPDWFIALNGEKDFTYQLTPYGQNNLCIAEEMNSDGKVVFAGTKDGKFSYLITAIRHDKYAEENRIEIELKKDN